METLIPSQRAAKKVTEHRDTATCNLDLSIGFTGFTGTNEAKSAIDTHQTIGISAAMGRLGVNLLPVAALRLQVDAGEVLADATAGDGGESAPSITEPIVHVDGGDVAATLSLQRVVHVHGADAQERTRLDHGGLVDERIVRHAGTEEVTISPQGTALAAEEFPPDVGFSSTPQPRTGVREDVQRWSDDLTGWITSRHWEILVQKLQAQTKLLEDAFLMDCQAFQNGNYSDSNPPRSKFSVVRKQFNTDAAQVGIATHHILIASTLKCTDQEQQLFVQP
uniref:Uncharacterized protein n=1 Tax=Anopheles farauti TaxID=69004 RepID=A0A182QW25_9DIPT